MREFNTGSFPKGLSLMLGSMREWVYDRSPTDALKFEGPLSELKETIATSESKVFQDMINDLLLKNTHRSTIEMYPSKTLEEEQLKVSQYIACHTSSYLSQNRINNPDPTAERERQACIDQSVNE